MGNRMKMNNEQHTEEDEKEQKLIRYYRHDEINTRWESHRTKWFVMLSTVHIRPSFNALVQDHTTNNG